MWMTTTKEFDKLIDKYTSDLLNGIDSNRTFHEGSNNFSVKTENDYLVFSIDLPGVKREDLSVTVIGNILTIKSKRDNKESRTSWNISKDYNTESVDAMLADGVLTLKISKSSSAATKTIEVKTA